jgi:hypothetical protein
VKTLALLGILAVAGAPTSANAFVVRAQWVLRVGNADMVIPTVGGVQTLAPAPRTSLRFRLQFGVFDDAAGPAPAGGYIGWNLGTMNISGGTNTRTPGRLAPFTFTPNPPGNGLPSADPFSALTAIDNTLGTQSPAWTCNPDGTIPPPPPFVIRGRNAFISTYEITTVTDFGDYSITVGGNTIVASRWDAIGSPLPPDCRDPNNPIPGSIIYAPMTLPPIPGLTAPLDIIITPAPGAAALLGIGGLIAGRRRRA